VHICRHVCRKRQRHLAQIVKPDVVSLQKGNDLLQLQRIADRPADLLDLI